jgi:hypothetical protein
MLKLLCGLLHFLDFGVHLLLTFLLRFSCFMHGYRNTLALGLASVHFGSDIFAYYFLAFAGF